MPFTGWSFTATSVSPTTIHPLASAGDGASDFMRWKPMTWHSHRDRQKCQDVFLSTLQLVARNHTPRQADTGSLCFRKNEVYDVLRYSGRIAHTTVTPSNTARLRPPRTFKWSSNFNPSVFFVPNFTSNSSCRIGTSSYPIVPVTHTATASAARATATRQQLARVMMWRPTEIAAPCSTDDTCPALPRWHELRLHRSWALFPVSQRSRERDNLCECGSYE